MNILSIPSGTRMLAITTHPDDDLLMCGLLRRASQTNCHTKLVCLTRGEGGLTGTGAETLAETRLNELKKSCALIGIDDFAVWYFPDSGLAEYPLKKIVDQIDNEINNFKPDWIVTFGPDGFTHHRGHQATSSLVSEAARLAGTHAEIYGITIPAQFQHAVMPHLQERRRTHAAYNDTVAHPNLEDTFTVPIDFALIAKLIEAYPSQNLGGYQEILHMLKMEHYVRLNAPGESS